MNKYILIGALTISSFSLAGCSGVKDSLGLEKESPDEFAVITRAPLEMPSKLALPPPTLGMARPQEQATNKQARKALLGETKNTNSNKLTLAEETLLQKAGASEVDPDIRAKIDKETYELQDRNKPVAEKLLNISGNNKRPSATIVDAEKEVERIKKNKQEGKNITDGEIPVIEE